MNFLSRFCWTLTLGITLYGVTARAQEAQTYSSFAELRARVTGEIGNASTTIRVVTPFLTDGDIVTGLFLAQYRKVNVQVLLGRERAQHYLSRLNYLKSQNIPVFLKPGTFAMPYPSALQIDRRLWFIDGNLDSLEKTRSFTLREANADQFHAFAAQFDAALNQALPVSARALPLVGKARYGTPTGRLVTPPQPAFTPVPKLPPPAPVTVIATPTPAPPKAATTSSLLPRPTPQPKGAYVPPATESAYNYDRAPAGVRNAGAQVIKQLPRETIVQQRQRQKANASSSAPHEAPSALPPAKNGGNGWNAPAQGQWKNPASTEEQ